MEVGRQRNAEGKRLDILYNQEEGKCMEASGVCIVNSKKWDRAACFHPFMFCFSEKCTETKGIYRGNSFFCAGCQIFIR